MSPKYWPLAQFLDTQPQDQVTLTLAEVEAILRRQLPGSAGLRWWWQSSRDARTWQAAGWRAQIDPWLRRVTFERMPPDPAG